MLRYRWRQRNTLLRFLVLTLDEIWRCRSPAKPVTTTAAMPEPASTRAHERQLSRQVAENTVENSEECRKNSPEAVSTRVAQCRLDMMGANGLVPGTRRQRLRRVQPCVPTIDGPARAGRRGGRRRPVVATADCSVEVVHHDRGAGARRGARPAGHPGAARRSGNREVRRRRPGAATPHRRRGHLGPDLDPLLP
jgi:hypothetical protein